MSTKVIAEIKRIVKERTESKNNIFGPEVWFSHFEPVVKYSQIMADTLGADKEIVTIAAYLHDIASVTDPALVNAHHIHGTEEAQKILLELNYPQEKIDQVKHCILTHRGSQKLKRETIEAQCVADADAMAHFDSLYSLFYMVYIARKMGQREGRDYVEAKLERSWNKLSPTAKSIVKAKYDAIKLIL